MAMAGPGKQPPNGNGETGPTGVPTESRWARSLGRLLASPTLVIDAEGNLAYFNPAAERLLGRSYGQVGPLPPQEWRALWTPTNVEGTPIPLERLPIMVALRERRPVHGWLHFMSLDGVRRWIESTAFPVEPDGGVLGAASLFWEPAVRR